ncbi:MAG: hotdog fold domain-containing protein [Usitatibacter sp.]
MNSALGLWRRCEPLPFGKALFSRVICWKAPYFASISPRFRELRPGYARVSMRKRRAVTNHIGTVHAIAMCNLAEIAAGTMTEISIPATMRWLPKSMQVEYLRKAGSDVEAEARADDLAEGPARDVPVRVDVKDRGGEVVCRATITMWVSPRKQP